MRTRADILISGDEVRVTGKKYIALLLVFVLLASLQLSLFRTPNVLGEAEMTPSKGWGMFFGTTGDVKIEITEHGVAVKIEVPRSFLRGTAETLRGYS